MSRALKVTGNHVMYDRGAWFLRVIMSSSRTLSCLLSVKKQKYDFHFFRSLYNKTIIRFGFCDIQNNQRLGKGYQAQPSASADNLYLDLDYSGYHKNLIQSSLTYRWSDNIANIYHHFTFNFIFSFAPC